jgi:uncharacterized protein (TIGR02453 family)
MTTSRATESNRAGAAADLPARFTGFPDEALGFYEGLEADNSRSYWEDHRDVFERAVRGPMLALVAELEAEFGAGKLFRPYRDVRFSTDKTPYKTHLGAVLGGDAAAASLYVQVSRTGLYVGGGYYHLAPDQLGRYRAAVLDDRLGTELAREVEALAAARITLIGDRLLRAPRGVDPAHPRVELLRHKGLAAARDFGAPGWLSTRRTMTEVAKLWRAIAPLTGWLTVNVGPSQVDRLSPGAPAAGGSSARSR